MEKEFNSEYIEAEFEVSEMDADAKGVVSLNKTRVQELLDIYNDDDPRFPVLRIEGGMSKNKFNYGTQVIRDVAEQINTNEALGYFGHVAQEDRAWKFPEPQTIWLGAKAVTEKGKEVLYVKGYLIPDTLAKKHVRAGVVKTASWFGKASGRIVNGITHVEKLDLESIDWTPKGRTAMNAGVVAIASEMEGGGNKVDLSGVTLDDIKSGNPSLFTLMKQNVTNEVRDELNVSEMEEKAKEADNAKTVFAKLRELFGIEEKTDFMTAMTEIHERLDNLSSKSLKEKVAEILTGKLKKESARNTVLRLLPVSEMEGLSDDELTKRVDEWLTTDTEVKLVISEMEQGPGPLNHSTGNNGDRGGHKVGGSNMVKETSTRL